MSRTIECAGHPRDMGFAQGRALAEAIRAEVARAGLATRRSRWPSLRPLVAGPLRGGGGGRELFRHFAHQAERLEGLAQAAELPLDSVVALQLRTRGASASAFFVRESRPVVGFRSLELACPWLVPALAGVNAAGLAVVAEWPARGEESGRDPRYADAPPLLLVQDCLARFENVVGALDWCGKRPVEGELVLRFLDASGAGARVVVAGRERRVERIEAVNGDDEPVLDGAFADPARSGSSCRVQLEPRARRLRCEGLALAAGVVSFEDVLPPHDEARSE
ncbi:MAG: hypothetical protein IPK00_11670 [Deltaproteobacteria bacterium]|nr:hypothetical protein [Deltaproteobacteria bacterium]